MCRRGDVTYSARGRSTCPAGGSRGGRGPGRSPGSRTPPRKTPFPDPPSPQAAAEVAEIASSGGAAMRMRSYPWRSQGRRRGAEARERGEERRLGTGPAVLGFALWSWNFTLLPLGRE